MTSIRTILQISLYLLTRLFSSHLEQFINIFFTSQSKEFRNQTMCFIIFNNLANFDRFNLFRNILVFLLIQFLFLGRNYNRLILFYFFLNRFRRFRFRLFFYLFLLFWFFRRWWGWRFFNRRRWRRRFFNWWWWRWFLYHYWLYFWHFDWFWRSICKRQIQIVQVFYWI